MASATDERLLQSRRTGPRCTGRVDHRTRARVRPATGSFAVADSPFHNPVMLEPRPTGRPNSLLACPSTPSPPGSLVDPSNVHLAEPFMASATDERLLQSRPAWPPNRLLAYPSTPSPPCSLADPSTAPLPEPYVASATADTLLPIT